MLGQTSWQNVAVQFPETLVYCIKSVYVKNSLLYKFIEGFLKNVNISEYK